MRSSRDDASGLTRREVLRRSAFVAAGALLGPALAPWISADGARAFAQGVAVHGLPSEVTPNSEFYLVSKNPPGFDPEVDASRWRLELAGRVTRPMQFTYDEIRALPSIEQYHTLECISNEIGGTLISNAKWRGVPLRTVLGMAGADINARKVAFRCADGYTESILTADALLPETLLAYEMNGERLSTKHGFPVRLLVGGLYGMKNPKWITRIEPIDNLLGYWEQRGWSDAAVVKTMSKFTMPDAGATARAGQPLEFGGVAYAGNRGIREVHLSTDDGRSWQPAQLKPPRGRHTWVLWTAAWTPPAPGSYQITVRAQDGVGQWQDAQETATLPDGASGYHRVRVQVRT
jgi:DMSO/TMAO reductase YedYZ molybdopterin-dependent catalytic subunit